MTSKKIGLVLIVFIAAVLMVGCSKKFQRVEIPLNSEIESGSSDGDTTQPEPGSEPNGGNTLSDAKGSDMISISVVYDNYPYQEGMETDWGFSAWITSGENNLLFDTGQKGSILLRNMSDIGLEPITIQNVMLSHEHDDHTGGLAALLSDGAEPALFIPPSFSTDFKTRYQDRLELIEVSPGLEIFDGFYSLGEMHGPPPEQSLVIDTSQGLVVVTGCAHPGVEDILQLAKEKFGKEIYLVIGGFHLGKAGSQQMDQIIEDFQQTGVKFVAPCHCTGEQQINTFQDAYGENFIQVGVGKVIEINP